MEELRANMQTGDRPPRLWIEQLSIFRTIKPVESIRDIHLRRGINIIWAHEPRITDKVSGLRATGHGVGKTSFCLLLRYCLGDQTKSIDLLREEVRPDFPDGGVGAVVHVDGRVFSAFRHFSPYREGFAAETSRLESLFTDASRMPYKEFEALLSDAMLARLEPKIIPNTDQTFEWRHMLAWLTRDQRTRFVNFYQWREGEGAGLQRSRQDPPLLMRAALGLLEHNETRLLQQIHTLERNIEAAQNEIAKLELEPTLIRRRIESNLRAWLGLDEEIPFTSDDLFMESVESRLTIRMNKAAQAIDKLDAQLEASGNELAVIRDELLQKQRQQELYENSVQLIEATLQNDENAYRRISERRKDLLKLTGSCEPGGVMFSECSYIANQISNPNFIDKRDKAALDNSISELSAKAVDARRKMDFAAGGVSKVNDKLTISKNAHNQLQIKRDTALREKQRGDDLWDELNRWQKSEGSSAARNALETARNEHKKLTEKQVSAKTKLALLHRNQSEREKSLSEQTDKIAQALLSNEVFARFSCRDELRPFQLSMRGGEAYRVLEILLGDAICMYDAAIGNAALPAFLLHDCPREADMSIHLYSNYLLQLVAMEDQLTPDACQAPFQYMLTTTSPPPSRLQRKPYLRLKLDPCSDASLLFKKRFGTNQQQFSERGERHESL